MKALMALLLTIALSGCDSPFDINPAIGAQVKIVLYGRQPIHLGVTFLTAELSDLNIVQKSEMNIVYEWHRISGDTDTVVTDQSANGVNTYTITSSDIGNSIKVKAVFKYRDSESSSEDIYHVVITELSVTNSSDLKNALMSINTSDSVKITADGVFSISDPIAVPASIELEIKSAVTIAENVTVLYGGKITVSSGNLIVLPGKIFRIEAGGSFNIASELSLDLHGTFDFSDDAALTVNGNVVCNSTSTLVRLPYNYSGNGKFVFSKGCIVRDLIGTGYKIDNYTYDNTIEYFKSNNKEIFTVNGDIRIIDTWTISGLLGINGNLIVLPGKIFRIEAGGSFNIASESSLDLHGTFDFSDNAALTVNGNVVCNSNSTLVRLPYNYSGNGKFVFLKGCIVRGLIGTGYKIDNYTYDNTIEYFKSNNKEIFTVNGDIRIIDTWTISGSLGVNGNVDIEPTKDIQGSSIDSEIKVGAAATVTGGINSLNLIENLTGETYYWDGNKWCKPAHAHAGDDLTTALAHNLTVTLDGTGSTGDITAYAWECASYTANQGAVKNPYTPAEVNALMNNANTAIATVALRKAGTYVFKLTITANNRKTDTDNVTVTVKSYTVRKDVKVDFPAFVPDSDSIDFTPTYDPDDGDREELSDSDITYTVTDNLDKTYDSETGFVVNISDGPYSDGTYTFTQVFKIDNTEIGGQVIQVVVSDGFAELKDEDGNSLPAIPSIDLKLEKTVTELP